MKNKDHYDLGRADGRAGKEAYKFQDSALQDAYDQGYKQGRANRELISLVDRETEELYPKQKRGIRY